MSLNLKKASIIEIADEVVRSTNKVALCRSILYIFNGKYYDAVDDEYFGQIIFNMYLASAPDAWTPTRAKNILAAIRFHPVISKVDEMDNYDDWINLNNGILNFLTKEFIPHSPDYFFTTCLNIEYNPNSQSPTFFLSLLDNIFYNPPIRDPKTKELLHPSSIDKDTIQNIIKIGGYLIYPKIKIHKMFIFFGTGSNGKSIIIEHVYKKFFDRKFMSSMSLNALSKEDNFSRKQLLTSRINVSTEQKSGDLESDELKKIVSGEDINIRRMREDTVTFSPKCKILLAQNRFAFFKDTSKGIRRRLFMVNFKNEFEKDPDKYSMLSNPEDARIFKSIPEDEIIENINKELPGIFNLFIDGLQELKNNNWHITESENTKEIFKEYLNDSDYVGTWLEAHFEVSDNDEISISDMLSLYKEWYEYNFPDKKAEMSSKLLGRRIKDVFRIQSQQRTVNISTNINNKNLTTTSVYNLKKKEDALWEMIHKDQPTNHLEQMHF